VSLCCRFLDNVIDANIYPLTEIADMVLGNRRIGLGIMGFADLLIQMEVAYGSPEAVAFAGRLMKFIQESAEDTSEELARDRGDFPNKHLSKWADDPRPRRNAARDEGFYSEALLEKVEANRGSLKGLNEVPQRWQAVFTVAADVSVNEHIDMLAAFQKYTCN